MKFWVSTAPLSLILVCALLALGALIRRLFPPLRRLGVPTSMIAGLLGLLLGPSVLGALPLDQDVLETVVYHGLAVLFIAVSLQPPEASEDAGVGVRSMAFAIPTLAVTQGIIGLTLVLIWTALGSPLHPGFGLMIPLGFSQGPGQALAMGAAWEDMGMVDGAQLGLSMAALGFLWCVVVGVPLVALARRRGWLEAVAPREPAAAAVGPRAAAEPGALEVLTLQIALVASVYLVTYGILSAAGAALAAKPGIAATIFGFHFLIGALLAIATRVGVVRAGLGEALDRPTLSRLAALVVDVVTVSAIAAVKISVVRAWLVPLLIFSSVGGTVTALLAIWASRRAFTQASFEHGLVLFGAATGTLATGLALLRIVDPELEGPVPASAVLGSAVALPMAAPLLGVMQIPVADWPGSYPGRVLLTLGILSVYLLALVAGWRLLGALRFKRPMLKLWPDP